MTAISAVRNTSTSKLNEAYRYAVNVTKKAPGPAGISHSSQWPSLQGESSLSGNEILTRHGQRAAPQHVAWLIQTRAVSCRVVPTARSDPDRHDSIYMQESYIVRLQLLSS